LIKASISASVVRMRAGGFISSGSLPRV
jgi:hypothetical protein